MSSHSIRPGDRLQALLRRQILQSEQLPHPMIPYSGTRNRNQNRNPNHFISTDMLFSISVFFYPDKACRESRQACRESRAGLSPGHDRLVSRSRHAVSRSRTACHGGHGKLSRVMASLLRDRMKLTRFEENFLRNGGTPTTKVLNILYKK
jgi:hypothetical protein